MPSKIKLPCFGITVEVIDGSGWIESDLKDGTIDHDGRCERTGSQTSCVDVAMDAIESMILAHACAGIDISANAYIEGIEVTVFAVIAELA